MRSCILFLFWALLFGIAYTQAPLYYSNQNQYFLHGLAHSGRGFLEQDWLANTKDPAPIFSAVVGFTHGYLNEHVFYLYYFLIFGIYFHSLVGLFVLLTRGEAGFLGRLCFITLFVAVHAGLLRLASARAFGVDYPWYLQAGLAGQYILGFGLQPSVCGVFLLASIYTFLSDKPWQAATWAALAGVLHSTYLLGAALLMVSYMLLLVKEKRVRTAFLVGLWALVLVSPVVLYNLMTFAPSSAEAFAEAQRVLAQFRIPHHAVPDRWFDGLALAQVAWMGLAMILARRSRLLVIMSVTLLGSLILTIIQLWTGNNTLALLFPWRTSAFLVPLSTTIVLATLVNLSGGWLRDRSPPQQLGIRMTCVALLAVCVAGGLAITFFKVGYRTNDDELPMLHFVQSHKQSGDVYLLPVDVPKSGSGRRGSFNSNFMPAPRAGKSGQFIAIDLQRFRLVTGAPIFVDFKSIPYKDVEVLEWYRRILWAAGMYAERDWNKDGILEELRTNGITHVVTTADRDIRCDALEKIYEDAHYHVFRVPESSATASESGS
jgi:hypothetical protein